MKKVKKTLCDIIFWLIDFCQKDIFSILTSKLTKTLAECRMSDVQLSSDDEKTRTEIQKEQDSLNSKSSGSESQFIGNDLLAYEKRRRNWFFLVVFIVMCFIASLYGIFIKWIFVHMDSEVKDYINIIIPLILAIIPTMLTIFVLKLLSKSEKDNHNDENQLWENMPVIEFVKQIAEAIRGK